MENRPQDRERDISLLEVLSLKLDILAKCVADVETAIGDAIADNEKLHPDDLAKIQMLDYVRQSLEDLTAVTEKAASERDACFEEICSVTKLETTQNVILRRVASNGPRGDSNGQVDFF